jgi:Carbohydrate binding domain
VLAAPFLFFRKAWANALVAGALLFQIADTQSLRHWVHVTVNEEHPSPLKSPIWSTLGAMHENLIVLPAWQCGGNAAPLGTESYRTFGFLAAKQKMRTNSYQSARYTEVARDWHCHQAIAALSEEPLSPDSVYVVTPELAARIAAGPTGPGKCHDLDRVILCSTKADFGLSPELMTPEDRLENAIANPGFEDGEVSPWSPVWEVNASASAARAYSGTHSLAEAGVGSVYQDITSLEPGATYTVYAWVSASPDATAAAQITVYDPTSNVASSSPFLTPGTDWEKLSQSFTAGAEGTARLHLLRGPGSGTIYWDDIRIAREK